MLRACLAILHSEVARLSSLDKREEIPITFLQVMAGEESCFSQRQGEVSAWEKLSGHFFSTVTSELNVLLRLKPLKSLSLVSRIPGFGIVVGLGKTLSIIATA